MKKYTFYLFVLFSIISTNVVRGQGVVINEIQSVNSSTIEDESGNNEDWIELYNNASVDVNLSGYGLSDNSALPFKWIFPNVTLGSKKFLLIWLSDKNKAVAGSPLHTNFKLSSSGEVISLTNKTGILVDKVDVKEMVSDISYGRSPNGTGGFVFFGNCTPNAVNSTISYAEFLQPPTFSAKSGFFTQGFNLTLSSATPGVVIYYTLDGSEPDPNNLDGTTYSYKNQYEEKTGQASGPLLQKKFQTLQYNSAISITDRSSLPNKISAISSTYHYNPYYIPDNPIFKGTVVRAKAVKPGALSSVVASRSYFISPQGSSRFKLPVVSLSVNENNLFDYNNGIYVAGVDFDKWRAANPNVDPGTTEGIGNYFRRTDADEKVANLTYLVNGSEVINQNIGISIHGGGSRHMQSKTFSIYPRSKYGKKGIDFKLFSDLETTNFERLTLNNSGQDFLFTMFRDALSQELCKSLHCESESYQPTVTFINGEYWGILNFREKYTDEYFSEMYNIGKNEIDFIEVQHSANEGDNIDYDNMIDYFEKNSLANNSNYNYIKTRLDPESFADFFIANIFLQNSDWPGNNVQCWRKRTIGYIANASYGHDGRWRWAFHDMDETFAFGTDDGFSVNTLALATAAGGLSYPNPDWSTLFLRKMLENTEFKIYFINRFADLMNTAFLSDRIISKMNTMKTTIESDMEEHISRWKNNEDIADWNYFLKFQEDFAKDRPGYVRDHIKKQFNIDKNINVTLDVSDIKQGYVKMNTIDILPSTPGVTVQAYPWTGIYYSAIPVKIKAVALPGYAFSHWTGASTSTTAEITLNPTADISLTAHFVPSPLSTNNNTVSNFFVYPNPVRDLLIISSHYDFINYEIFSVDGKTVSKGQLESGELNVSSLSTGVYFLHLKVDTLMEVKTFIKF